MPLDPVDGRTVGTDTPALLLRNAADPDGDALTYEIAVRDAAGAVVAAATGIASGVDETAWTVTTALAENQAFTWSARASDAEIQGPWSAPAAFRVDAVVEPPTAPVPLLPADGAVVEERRPALVVVNATSPDGLALAYAFELEAVAADGSTSPVARVEGVAETEDTTAWTPPLDLADGSYQWRARASDARASGPWSATSRFAVLVDPPPAAPLGLRALAGDAARAPRLEREPRARRERLPRVPLDHRGRAPRLRRGRDHAGPRRPGAHERPHLLLCRDRHRRPCGERALERGGGAARGPGDARGRSPLRSGRDPRRVPPPGPAGAP